MPIPIQLDMQGVYGTTLSILFIVLAHFFESLTILSSLQAFAYILSSLIAIDTLLGNKLKNYITKKLRKDENKSKRSNPTKKV